MEGGRPPSRLTLNMRHRNKPHFLDPTHIFNAGLGRKLTVTPRNGEQHGK